MTKFKVGEQVISYAHERAMKERRPRDIDAFSGVITEIKKDVATIKTKKSTIYSPFCCLRKLDDDELIHIIAANLIDGLKELNSKRKVAFIKKRLREIAEENSMTLEQLNEYCWADSTEMFNIIFDYKDFDVNNFHCN